jgi:hypothetical protein
MQGYLIGSPVTPSLVVVDEKMMVRIVVDTVNAGRRVVISKVGHAGQMSCRSEMDGLVCEYQVNNRVLTLGEYPVWAHRLQKLLSESNNDKETT